MKYVNIYVKKWKTKKYIYKYGLFKQKIKYYLIVFSFLRHYLGGAKVILKHFQTQSTYLRQVFAVII